MRRLLVGFAFVVAVTFSAATAWALDVPAAPTLDRPIVDQTGTLTAEQIDTLAEQIKTSRGEKDYQVAVLIIPTLDGAAIEDYAIQVARTWGVGEKEKNNGLLLLIAKDDHKLRIEVGRGLEGDLTDIQTGHIIQDVITPKFRQNDFYGGIDDGLESMAALVQGKADPHPYSVQSTKNPESIAEVIIFIGFAIFTMASWLAAVLARSKSWWAGGVLGGVTGFLICLGIGFTLVATGWLIGLVLIGLLFDWLVSRNYHARKARGLDPSWWAGGTYIGGGGSESSGGSFGGGGFSGGGASGSW